MKLEEIDIEGFGPIADEDKILSASMKMRQKKNLKDQMKDRLGSFRKKEKVVSAENRKKIDKQEQCVLSLEDFKENDQILFLTCKS